MPPPELHFVAVDDLRIAVWEWAGEGLPLLFAHATGFHGRCWDHIVRLAPGQRAFALEFRGHGRSSMVVPPVSWIPFARDVLAVVRHFDLHGVTAIGHSMGGYAVVSAAIQQAGIFERMVLLDPVIWSPEYYAAPPPDAGFIARRRNRWKSAGELFDRFHTRAPFSEWDADALRSYCEYALRPDGDDFVLCCPPEVEASIYAQCNAPENDFYAGIPAIDAPVTILRAGTVQTSATLDLNASPTAPDLASKFRHGRDVYLPGHNHYIPMVDPELVVEAIVTPRASRG